MPLLLVRMLSTAKHDVKTIGVKKRFDYYRKNRTIDGFTLVNRLISQCFVGRETTTPNNVR